MLKNILFRLLMRINRGGNTKKSIKSVRKMRMIEESTLVSNIRYATPGIIPEHLQTMLEADKHDILCR